MSVTVERFQGLPVEWDGLVRSQPGWTHFQLLGWRAVMERALELECVPLAARDSTGRLCGVLPLVRVSSRLFGRYLVSMPFVNYGGPLGEPGAVTALVQHAAELADEDGRALLELRNRSELAVDLPLSHRKITVLLDLPAGRPDELWRRLPPKVRSQVRRPEKEGIEVRFGPDQLTPFFGVFARHMRDLGTPSQSIGFFRAMAEQFPDDIWFGCAFLRGEAVAAGCGFSWAGEFEMTWASALRVYAPLSPNMLLYWSFLRRAAELDHAVFNFGRCTPGGGTHRFKRQWGGRDEPLWWYHHARGRRQATPSPTEGAFSWGPSIWRQLPLPFATWLGPRIVRHLP